MNYKLILPFLFLLQVGCSANNEANRFYNIQSAVTTQLDGTFIVRKNNKTPKSNLDDSRYFQYYAGLYANSIGCKSYSEVKRNIGDSRKAYRCVANGQYLTTNSVALGTPWQ